MSCFSSEILSEEITKCMEQLNGISLSSAKRLLEALEQESRRRQLNMVMSVCGPAGHMIAVHAMDDAFLVSFELSMKKAYTAVALKTTTMDWGQRIGPGQDSFGVDRMGDNKIVVVAGGVPLVSGGRIIGGLGVSGGTGEQDHRLAEYGAGLVAAPDFFTR